MKTSKKQTMVQIGAVLDAVIAANSQGENVYKAMAERIEKRREQGIDRLIDEHASDGDMNDLLDEISFEESQNESK